MASEDQARKLMADMTMALEEAHEAAVRAQSPRLCTALFGDHARLAMNKARLALDLAQEALHAQERDG